jgi:threonine/homoserine efflux transporter RhtA
MMSRPQLQRAAPRLAAFLVGFVLLVASGSTVLQSVGAVIAIAATLGAGKRWMHYVRTGERVGTRDRSV